MCQVCGDVDPMLEILDCLGESVSDCWWMFGIWMLKFVVIRLPIMFKNIVTCKQPLFFPIPNLHLNLFLPLHHPPPTPPKNLTPPLPPHKTLTTTIKPNPFPNPPINDKPLINSINNIKNVNISNKINNR